MDKAGNFVIAPSFSSLEIFRNVIIGTYNGKKGALSRTETITSSFYAPILPFVYDDIKITTACGTLSYLIIVKNGLQGIFCIEDKEIVLEPKINEEYYLLTSSLRHPKFFVKEFSYFLMSCHQHCLGVNLLVQRQLNLYGSDGLCQCKHLVCTHFNL